MTNSFQRARSAEAKEQRENDILQAARALAAKHGIRAITLTEIANAIGMHKSALLRYFETREQIFLILAGQGWREWSSVLRAELAGIEAPSPLSVAETFARTLVAQPLFCDLLAHVPLNLERNVSVKTVRDFKLIALEEVAAIATEMETRLGLSRPQAVNVISTATSMAGALWQMATPGPDVARLYREEPLLAHAVIEVEPRLENILSGLIAGYVGSSSPSRGHSRIKRDIRKCDP